MRPRPRTPPARNPYSVPRSPAKSSGRPRWRSTRLLLWGVLLAPYLVFSFVFLSVVGLARIDIHFSNQVREALICTAAGMGGGSVRAAFLWPAAFLLEHVLRRMRSSRDGFRCLALGILAVGVYTFVPIDVLTRCQVVSEDHPAIVGLSFSLVFFELAAVPLFLVWIGLALFQRSR